MVGLGRPRPWVMFSVFPSFSESAVGHAPGTASKFARKRDKSMDMEFMRTMPGAARSRKDANTVNSRFGSMGANRDVASHRIRCPGDWRGYAAAKIDSEVRHNTYCDALPEQMRNIAM